MISFGRMTPGHAGYFEGEVAAGREDYYAGRGESPGVWKGAGAAGLGLEGRVLDGQLSALFEMRDPLSGEALGNVGYKVADTYIDQFGVEQVRHKRSGFDATFSVPKSVSLLYAYGDSSMQAEILEASQAAVDAALAHLDKHAAFSRTGKGGVNQVDTDGLVVGQFMHRTSRAGDPQLHFHLLVSNRVRCTTDGKWRALDGRPLHAELKTAGMIGQAVLRAELQRRLRVAWHPVSEHGQAEIVGVPAELMDLQSKRTKTVAAHAGAAIAEAEANLARALTAAERAEKYDAAAVQTRAVKTRHHQPIEGLHDRWTAEAIDAGYDPTDWLPGVTRPSLSAVLAQPEPKAADELIAEVLEHLTETHSTWKRSDVTRAFARLIPTATAPNGAAVAARIETLTDALLEQAEQVVELTAPHLTDGPVRASDGRPVTEPHHVRTYTTLETLRREQTVLDHAENGRNTSHTLVNETIVDDTINTADKALSDDQAAAVRRITTSGDAVSVLVGPAGAGKSTTIGTAAQAFTAAGYRVRGLAVSAVAAAVLRDDAGLEHADTLAKLLHEHRSPTGPDPALQIRAGDVLVVDEASMVTTTDLHRLVELAAPVGAKIVLVGDYRQLGAIGAGGLFAHIARTSRIDTHLDTIWRFTNPWEQAASLRLRDADPDIIDTYNTHGRVHGSTAPVDDAFNHWLQHDPASVIVTADNNDTVNHFNQRARHHLQTHGHIGPDQIELAGRRYATGDHVITGHNDRTLTTNTGRYLRNGDHWTITRIHTANNDVAGIDLANPNGETITLSPVYLTRSDNSLNHAYATTTHKAQGQTHDHAIAITSPTTTAEALYVAATRGRHANHLYVDTTPDETEHGPLAPTSPPDPTAILRAVLNRTTTEQTATQTLTDNLTRNGDTDPIDAVLEQLQQLDQQLHTLTERLNAARQQRDHHLTIRNNHATTAQKRVIPRRSDLEQLQQLDTDLDRHETALHRLETEHQRLTQQRAQLTRHYTHLNQQQTASRAQGRPPTERHL